MFYETVVDLLCATSVSSVSLWLMWFEKGYHRDTEDTDVAQRKNQFPGVRGFALSPEAVVGNGGKLSLSLGAAIDVAPCRLTSSNLLNSANSFSASSFFLSREYARNS